MTDKHRILLVEASGRGFLAQYAHALASGLTELGHEVRMVSGLRDELAGWPISFDKRACLSAGPGGWLCLARHVREFRPHVVHMQWVDNPFVALAFVLWLKRRGIRSVYTPHNLLPHRRRWLSIPGFRLLVHTMDQVVARDDNIAWGLEEILSLPPERIACLPGSPNLMAHPNAPRAPLRELTARKAWEFRVLFFGHGSGRKGLANLLETLASHKWPDRFHFVIAGEGVLRGTDGKTLRKASASCRLTVINRYIEPECVADLFESSDLMVMPYVKRCKSPLLDLAAAFRLPVLRSGRVEGARFVEGVHGFTRRFLNGRDLHAELVNLFENRIVLTQAQAAMNREESLLTSINRLARGHDRLYARLSRQEEAQHVVKAAVARIKG